MKQKRMHYGGSLMYAHGKGLYVYTGGTQACDNRESDQLTKDRAKVTCPRCLAKLQRHDAYEKRPQPRIAREVRASLNKSNEVLAKVEITAIAEEMKG
jgi:hypothetical protein